MSQENIDVVREAIEAWNAGDMDRLREAYDLNVVVRPPPNWPEGATPVVGRDAVMKTFGQLREALDGDALHVVGDFLAAGQTVVVRYAWKGAGHGPPMSMEMTYVYTVRSGRILEAEVFWDHAEALEAAGLPE